MLLIPFLTPSRLLAAFVAACAWGAACTNAARAYTGQDSSEAAYAFESYVDLDSPGAPPTDEAVQNVVRAQTDFLIGTMRQGLTGTKAVPRLPGKITHQSVVSRGGDTYRARYRYDGVMLMTWAPGAPVQTTFDFLLPVRPADVWLMQVGPNPDNDEVSDDRCSTYDFPADEYWYYWNPTKTGCHFRDGVEYIRIRAGVVRIANTVRTYPEYGRLIDPYGNLSIHVLFGMNEEGTSPDPLVSKDVGAKTYRIMRDRLVAAGFRARILTLAEKQVIMDLQKPVISWAEEFTKPMPLSASALGGTFTVRLFYGDTHVDKDSEDFHHFLKDAVEHASIVVYAGHSGLGANLDIKYIEEREGFGISFDPDRYQILYLNGCVTYTYYADMWTKRKATETDARGTKSLDIMTNGLEGYFGEWLVHHNYLIIQAVDDFLFKRKRTSYQEIAAKASRGFLWGVTGDEDNPTQ